VDVDHDLGDEDDGDLKRAVALQKEWIRSQRFQPMIAPKGMLFYQDIYYGIRVIENHDGGDEDRRDIRPVYRPYRPWRCIRREDYRRVR